MNSRRSCGITRMLLATFGAMIVGASLGLAAPTRATSGATPRTAPAVRVQPPSAAVAGPRATGPRVQPSAAVLSFSPIEVEILEDRGPDFRYWRSEMVLELSDNQYAMTRPVRWKTEFAGAKSAVWQVALFPYPASAKAWDSPPGLLATGVIKDIPQPGAYGEFPIAFLKFAPGAPQTLKAPGTQTGRAARIADIGPAAAKAVVPPSGTASPAIRGSLPAIAPTAKSGAVVSSHARLVQAKAFTYNDAVAVILQNTLPVRYYLRVVTLGANGKPNANPSPPVVVTLDKPQPLPEDVAKALAMDGKHPAARLISYTPLRDQALDAPYHVVVTHDIPDYTDVPGFGGWGGGTAPDHPQKLLYYKGQKLDLTPPPYEAPSAWEQFLSDLGSTKEYLANIINSVSQAYDYAKRALIVALLPEELQGPAMAALDIGLAALGVPPSIPNFSELANMGGDYLIAELADQAGISPDLAQQAVHGVIEATQKAENGEGSSPSWIKPDPDYQYRDTTVVFEISNPGPEATDAVTLQVRTRGQDRDLLLPQAIPIPPIAPGQTMRVPVCLTKNIRIDAEGSHVDEWQQEYYTKGEMKLEAWTEWQQGGYFPQRHVIVSETIATTKVHYGKGVIPPMPHGK